MEKKNFKLNLERFYCENLRKKIKDSGDGKFPVITVKDEKPVYKFEQTLRRFELVNSKVLNMKKELKKLTSSPKKLRFRVHATDNTNEVDNNLMFILGKSYDEYYDYAINKTFDGNYIKIKQEPVGTNGWCNLNEVFRLLNSYLTYVCFEDINEKTSEINILADDYICVNYLLNGKNAYNKKFSKNIKINIGEKTYKNSTSRLGN